MPRRKAATKRPPGRPAKPPELRRSVRLELLLTQMERDALGKRALRYGLPLRDLLVRGALSYTPPGMDP